MGLDLLMLIIWDLLVKGLQSCWPSNLGNDLTQGSLEPGLVALACISAGMAEVEDFFLKTLTLTTSNFAAN